MADEQAVEEIEEEVQEEESGGDDLRGLIEDAFDGGDGEGAEPGGGGAPEETGEGSPSTGIAAEDGEGATGGVRSEESSVAAGDLSAPIDWSPELREQWKELSDPVKKKVAERETQIAQTMQGTAQARRIAQDFSGVANQYGSVMAAEGVDNPVQMFDNVMRTVSELRMGTKQQKAAKLAELVQNYGVDINELDSALTSQITGKPQAQSGNPDLEAMLDQRMAPVNQMMQQLAQMQQTKQQASVQTAQQEVDNFSKGAEFLNDVRHDVADLIDLATKQGRNMPLQEAYDKACAMNPQIADVLSKREHQSKLTQNQQTIAGKRNASSSLRPGNPGSSGGSPNSDTLTGALNAAWDDQIG